MRRFCSSPRAKVRLGRVASRWRESLDEAALVFWFWVWWWFRKRFSLLLSLLDDTTSSSLFSTFREEEAATSKSESIAGELKRMKRKKIEMWWFRNGDDRLFDDDDGDEALFWPWSWLKSLSISLSLLPSSLSSFFAAPWSSPSSSSMRRQHKHFFAFKKMGSSFTRFTYFNPFCVLRRQVTSRTQRRRDRSNWPSAFFNLKIWREFFPNVIWTFFRSDYHLFVQETEAILKSVLPVCYCYHALGICRH